MNRQSLRYNLILRWIDLISHGDFDKADRIMQIVRKWLSVAMIIIISSCHLTTEKLIETALWNASTISYALKAEHVPHYLWATCPNQSCVHSSFDLKKAQEECAKHEFCEVTKH